MEEKLAYQVDEVAKLLGISRGTAYQLVKRDDFPSVRVGEHRIIIPKEAFNKWLESQSQMGGI